MKNLLRIVVGLVAIPLAVVLILPAIVLHLLWCAGDEVLEAINDRSRRSTTQEHKP